MSPPDGVLVLPGLNGSGPGHWQSWFESEITGALRVQQPLLQVSRTGSSCRSWT